MPITGDSLPDAPTNAENPYHVDSIEQCSCIRQNGCDREAKATPNRAPHPTLLVRFSGNALRSRAGLDPHFAHAPQHVADTPHMDSDSCAGALSGRHKTPPDHDGAVTRR
jgi:hypothetical protein